MELKLKQRLLGAVTVVSVVAIFLPFILDGAGYEYLTTRHSYISATSPDSSVTRKPPDLEKYGSKVVITQERVDAGSLSAEKNWFVHVADRRSIDAANSLIRFLVDGGYKASYRMISRGGTEVFRVEIKTGASRTDGETIAMKIRKEHGFNTRLVQR